MAGVVIGLSGGVDSAVAAAELKSRGYEVTGLYLENGAVSEAEAAREIAEKLKIGFMTKSIEEPLEKYVCAPFVSAYLAGKTPSPCTVCNPLVKFPALIDTADLIGAELIATGHYARTEKEDGVYFIKTAASSNDQSYMLARLGQDVLSRLLLSLGDFESKKAVRKRAAELGLSAARKPDSMEICFIPDRDYAAYIERRGLRGKNGNFVDVSGNVIAPHHGIHHYTVGQRRGLGVALGQCAYVKKIDPLSGDITLAFESDMMTGSITVKDIYLPGARGRKSFRARVKVRHSKAFYDAAVTVEEDCCRVLFDEPIRFPAPGQMAVFYENDRVTGCGEIV